MTVAALSSVPDLLRHESNATVRTSLVRLRVYPFSCACAPGRKLRSGFTDLINVLSPCFIAALTSCTYRLSCCTNDAPGSVWEVLGLNLKSTVILT
jgi:hypothetical protein